VATRGRRRLERVRTERFPACCLMTVVDITGRAQEVGLHLASKLEAEESDSVTKDAAGVQWKFRLHAYQRRGMYVSQKRDTFTRVAGEPAERLCLHESS
jgi:hypothetical protein